MRQSWLLAAFLIASATPAGAAALDQKTSPTEDITVVGKRAAPITPNTSYWVEDGFQTYPQLGPTFAKGLIIWNHPEPWNGIGASFPTAHVLEGLAELGWDVSRLQRNGRLSGDWEAKLGRIDDALDIAIGNARAQGYQRIVIAGQDMGGGFALEAGRHFDALYGVIALAPNSGIFWGNGKLAPIGMPTDRDGQLMLTRTWDELEHLHPLRLMLLFPAADEQVPHERGPTAREILGRRGDMPFLLVDETSGVRTTEGADTPDFDAYASCLDLFLEPDAAPKPGEFHCGADEVPTALAQMGVKPHGGEAWFGYGTNGQTIYLELPASGKGSALYAWGAGANGKTRPGFRSVEPKSTGDGFIAALGPDMVMRGMHIGRQLRVTIDQDDGTRVAVAMHRVAGNS